MHSQFRAFFGVRNLIAFACSTVLLTANLSPIAEAANDRVIDIAQITWTGAARPDVSSGEIASAIQTNVSQNWKRFTTLEGDGQDRSLNFIVGKTLDTPIKLSFPMSCEGNGFNSFTNALRSEVYTKLGISDFKSRYLVALSPAAGCIWSGRATLGSYSNPGGVVILHNTASAFVITHELGHTLGLGHSNLLRCDTYAKDGAWSRNCKAVEYGGSIDVMGNVETDSSLSTYHQWRMGLLDPADIKQSWLNETIDLNATDVAGGTRAVFIRDGGSTYWIEYRKPSTLNTYKAGLVVFRTDPPPISFIESPNPEDEFGASSGQGVTTDMWMLNLDNYNYSSTGRATGSMTLPTGSSLTFFSGNVSIEASQSTSNNRVRLKITRRPDVTPPPTPVLAASNAWVSQDSNIIGGLYEDQDSIISHFEIKVNDVASPDKFGSKADFVPTYLDPFVSRRALFVRDLPEGSFLLSIRSVDVWGNASNWSKSQRVLIDRSRPFVGTSISLLNLANKNARVSLDDFSDIGSGLCKTTLINPIGFKIQSSDAKRSPVFDLKAGETSNVDFETFDCLGNGIKGKIKFTSSVKSPQDVTRSGKWSPIKDGDFSGLKCTGKCTLSTTVRENVSLLVGEGSADVLVGGKIVGRIPASSKSAVRVGFTSSTGNQSKLMRISGKDFAIYGIFQSKMEVTEKSEINRVSETKDPSLNDVTQSRLSKFGLAQDDFSNGWTVIPMERGTTLLDPTLDLCSASYKSEAGRMYRRQVIVLRSDSPYLFLSSEVVKYRDSEAASLALKELQSNFEACVRNKGGIESGGTFVDYVFSPLPSSDAPLVREDSRVLVRAQIGKGASARQLLAFYQFNGEMFTGLYIVKSGEIPLSDNEVKSWFDVAGVLAQRLETKF